MGRRAPPRHHSRPRRSRPCRREGQGGPKQLVATAGLLRAYAQRHRRRITDETALTALAWLSLRLDEYVHSCESSPALLEQIEAPISVMHRAVARLEDPNPIEPDRSDLRSLRSSGQPWPVVSRIAELVARVDHDAAFVAFELLYPEPDLASRLFHLNAFGEVLRTLRGSGFRCTWRSPIGGARDRPAAPVC